MNGLNGLPVPPPAAWPNDKDKGPALEVIALVTMLKSKHAKIFQNANGAIGLLGTNVQILVDQVVAKSDSDFAMTEETAMGIRFSTRRALKMRLALKRRKGNG